MTGLFRHRPARRRLAVAFAAMAAAAGCAHIRAPELPMPLHQAEDLTPMAQVPPGAAWVNPAGLQLAFQRDLPGGAEQRLLLANQSAVPGDNQLVIRLRHTFGEPGRLRFEEFLRRAGGLPPPFEALESGSFTDAGDDLGPYSWAEERFGPGTVCVLAVRRLDSAGRHLPAGADAMDMMLRNCVAGPAETALAPILAPSVMGGAAAGQGPSRMLSALAGPSQ